MNKNNNNYVVTGSETLKPDNKIILIVEDDRLLYKLLNDKLNKREYTTIAAENGEIALQELEKDIPDLILLDIMMPKMTGFELLKTIKNSEKYKNIPIIIITNFGGEEDVKKGMELGANDFLIKAHNTPDDIVSKITTLLRKVK